MRRSKLSASRTDRLTRLGETGHENCNVLNVDPKLVCWDAATETLDGDVEAVIYNILRAKYGEDWSPVSLLA